MLGISNPIANSVARPGPSKFPQYRTKNRFPDSYPPLKRLFSHPGGMFIRMLITSLLYEARRRHPGSFLTLARTERWIKLPKDLTKKLAPFEVCRRLLSLFSADGGRRLPFRTQTTDPL